MFNYAGIDTVALAAAYLVRRPRQANAIAIGVAGLVALGLALGPSLKIDEEKPYLPTRGAEQHLMPQGVAPELP